MPSATVADPIALIRSQARRAAAGRSITLWIWRRIAIAQQARAERKIAETLVGLGHRGLVEDYLAARRRP